MTIKVSLSIFAIGAIWFWAENASAERSDFGMVADHAAGEVKIAPTTVAAPAGLIAFCERRAEHCRQPGNDLSAALIAARRLLWSELFAKARDRQTEPASIGGGIRHRHGRQDEASAWLAVAADERVALSSENWATVVAVNAAVNRAIRDTSDQRQYGKPDVWEVVQVAGRRRGRGDCEDYALSKRARLIAEGLPEAALSIALVTTAWGEPHAVLLIATDAGDYVLDNLSSRIEHWSRSDVTWTSRQRPGDLLSWIGLDNG